MLDKICPTLKVRDDLKGSVADSGDKTSSSQVNGYSANVNFPKVAKLTDCEPSNTQYLILTLPIAVFTSLFRCRGVLSARSLSGQRRKTASLTSLWTISNKS